MAKITKLMLSEIISVFFVTLGIFFSISIVIDLFENIDTIMSLKLMKILEFYLFRSPYLISQILHYSILISCIISLNIMSKNQELVALLSSGINYRRIFFVMFVFITPLSFLNFLNDGFLAPKFLLKSERMSKKNKIFNIPSLSNISDVVFKTDKGFTYIDLIMPTGNMLLNTYIVEINENVIDKFYFSPVVIKNGDKWEAENVKSISTKERKIIVSKKMELPQSLFITNISNFTYQPSWLTINQAYKIIKAGNDSGINIGGYTYQLAKRFFRFFSTILLFFILFPFGFQIGRNKKNIEAIFLAMIIVTFYFVAETFAFKFFQTTSTNVIIPISILSLAFISAGYINWKIQLKNFA